MGNQWVARRSRGAGHASALACLTLILWGRVAAAEPPCQGPLDATQVARCALSHSPEVAAGRLRMQALAQQRSSAGRWLPSHPLLSFSLAERRPPMSTTGEVGAAALNGYFTLSQEFEIAGQRGRRLAMLDAEAAAELRRLAALEQETVASALSAYVEVLSMREELALAEQAAEVAAALSRFSSARAAQELLPQVESDLARAEAARLSLLRAEVALRGRNAGALLSALLQSPQGLAAGGAELSPPAQAQGPLDAVLPLLTTDGAAGESEAERAGTGLVAQALKLRADVAVAQAEVRVREAQWALLRRARIPNLSLSFTAQSDGFSERVLGGGLSIPLPLPEPLGPSRGGEIAAAATAISEAQVLVGKREREVGLEVRRAHHAVLAAERSLAEVPADLINRAKTDLWAIAEAIRSGRVALREALLWQRGLLELLQLHLRARRELALSRIELRRAVGLPILPGGSSAPTSAAPGEPR